MLFIANKTKTKYSIEDSFTLDYLKIQDIFSPKIDLKLYKGLADDLFTYL